ncbi:hypothetical protein X943_001706 [Babesia divergens]|uniref:Uncharacterized protein n=1 Tax=Babesia divergens TaxID=32595 RepID=A0AAD9G708_BABDI|nr:hypothetical protein X943_001706 [Babesia divergens]
MDSDILSTKLETEETFSAGMDAGAVSDNGNSPSAEADLLQAEDSPEQEADIPHTETTQSDVDQRILELEQKLIDKERNCLLLEQQLVQANQQVESCYYELEENKERLSKYGVEVADLNSALERKDIELKNARMENERAALVEAEKSNLSEMVAKLTDELQDKTKKLEEAMIAVDDSQKRVSEAVSEASRLQKAVESVEIECEAHKRKAADVYEMYQQLQEENLGLAKQLKDHTDSIPVVEEGPTARYHELSAEVESLTRKCKEMDDVLLAKDDEINELQQRIASLESEAKKASSIHLPAPVNTKSTIDEAELKRLENEVRMLKMSNAGLVKESAALQSQIAEKNARIDHLNCEVLSMRQTSTPNAKRDLDLESYLDCRRGGINANEAVSKIHDVRSFRDMFQVAAEDEKFRRYLIAYLAVIHIFGIFGILR